MICDEYMKIFSQSGEKLFRRLELLWALYRELLGWRGILLLVLTGLAVSSLQLVGLALIYPFLKLVTDPAFFNHLISLLGSSPFSSWISDYKNTLFLFGLLLIGIFLLIRLISARLVKYQSGIAADINARISDELIASALKSRYQLFMDHSPVKIGGASYSHTMHVALILQSASSAFSELVLLGFMLAGLLFSSRVAFLGFMVLAFILYWGFFRPTSHRVAIIGRRTQVVELERHKFVFAMASAIRDIKIMGLEPFFMRRNRILANQHADLAAEYSTIGTVQRLTIEAILFCGVVIAATWFLLVGEDLSYAVPTVALLGMLAIRLAPAFSRIAGAYNSFRYSLPVVEELIELRGNLMKYPQQRQEQIADFPGEYLAQSLHFSYGEHEVITNCSIKIGQGEVIAVVGPSGSGKSTLLDLLAGLQPPSSGSFTLNGKEFSPFYSAIFPTRIGYVPQVITLLDGTLAFNIALEENPDTERLQRAIRRASLMDLEQSLPLGVQTLLGDNGLGLSGGQRQRVGIARALYREPAFLILDEVTSALDEVTARVIMDELLSMRGLISMLFVTHDLRLVPADRIYQLDLGVISVYKK
jgi:ABC-type bacteriocin/lantibiotic exporter with double-glycine peptidase domain